MNNRGKIAVILFAFMFGCSDDPKTVAEDASDGDVTELRDGQMHDSKDSQASNFKEDSGTSEQDGQTEVDADTFDADEADMSCDNSGCSRFATCDDSNDEIECVCQDGFSGDGYRCVDVNECVEEDICDENAVCENLPGDYSCKCNDGYEGDGKDCSDIDECEENEDDCSRNATCTNTVGGFACKCKEGYEGNGRSCTDIDECEGDTATCHPDANCVNEEPGFSCECRAGFTGDGYATGDSSGCQDIDECANETYSCPANTRCRNLRGGDPGYSCQCEVGYASDGDECRPLCEIALEDESKCGENARCHIDENGEAVCTDCADGFTGDGMTCTPYCRDGGTYKCGTNTICDEEHDECHCRDGFTGDPNVACDDIDECDPGDLGYGHACDCDSEASCTDSSDVTFCFNNPGGYSCECISGYWKQQGECVNIDECAEDTHDCGEGGDASCICDPLSTCQDETPGFQCICDDGYKGDGKVSCIDINECTDATYSNECNDEVSRCQNLAGNNGKYRCNDINECDPNETEHPDGCDPLAICTNRVCNNTTTCRDSDFEGYRCSCDEDEGYLGSGYGSTGCHCDFTGYWAMRSDINISWGDIFAGISSGSLDTTAWELHKYEYDGEKITVEKKGCGQYGWPEISVVIGETYSTFLPIDVFDSLPLFPGVDIPLSVEDARPNKNFATPTEAAVVGMDLDDPLTSDWPEYSDTDIPWHDTDDDGIDGVTIWSRGPNEESRRGRPFSYTPVEIEGVDIKARAGCFSGAIRTRTHLNMKVESCFRFTGNVEEDYDPESLFFDCTLVEKDDWEERDVVCTDLDDPDSDWNTAPRCESKHVEDLNSADTAQETTTSFELVKMSKSNPTCADVRALLPPLY